MDKNLSRCLRALPKTESHLHLEGAIPFELLQTLPDGPTQPPASWADDFRFSDFSHFDNALLGAVSPWFASPERYGQAARAVFARLLEQNVRYVETSFASGVIQFSGMDGGVVAQAIREAVPEGMQAKIFFGIHHNGRPPAMERVLEDALSWKYLDGVDLHGDENVPLEDWTPAYWEAARKAGKHTKAHAGELCGPSFVREVLEKLGVRQIEHGVRAAEDPALVRELARGKIVLDVCPTSNVKLKVCADYASHPLRALRKAGVLCTLNSDDPVVFGGDLCTEYDNAFSRMGCTAQECFDIARDGWRAAKVDDATRAEMLAQVEAARAEFLA